MFDEKKFKAAIVLSGKTMADVADFLQINSSTFYRKIARNGDFSREEIQKIREFLKLECPDDIFFADKLA